jgi:hypothetical protein
MDDMRLATESKYFIQSRKAPKLVFILLTSELLGEHLKNIIVLITMLL